MAEQNTVIAATLKVDASQAAAASKTTAELKQNIKDLQKEFDNAKVGSAEQAEAFKKLKAAQDDLKNSVNNLNKSASETTTHFSNIKENIGKVNPAFSGATEGVGKLSAAFKALLANPIVLLITAIVGALALLYKAFTNTFEGAEKVEQIFAGLKAAAQALFDDLSRIGSAIVKFFSFDFSGAADEIKGIVDDVGKAYTAMSNLTKQAQELHKEQLQNDLEAAQRQKQLAILREQATDEDVPVAKRKAALKELQAAAEENAKQDIDLAKRTAENKIAQLTLEKDGARKNQDEINKIRIEQIQVETENANELRRIGKQLTAAEKQEQAERTAAAKQSAEERKKIAADLLEYQKTLLKLQQDNQLLGIKDANEKEKQALENRISEQKRGFDEQLKSRKINQAQYNALINELNISANLQEDALREKHNKEIADKEAAFQKELAAIRTKLSVDAIKDTREKERVELQIGYEQKLNDAIKRYKDDQTKLQQIKDALQDELKAAQDKLDAKNLKEDQKKGFALSEAANQKIIDANNFEFEAKKAALDAQQQLVQDAFDQQFITEQEYNAKTQQLSESRIAIRDLERQHSAATVSAIGDGLETLAELAGKQTATGKALAIASTTIKTFQSAISAFAGIVEQIPGPVGIALGVVAAAGAVASGIAAVKKILAVQIPGQGSGGGSAPTGLPAQPAPVAPTQSGTKIDQNSIKGIGDATSGRVYVLDSDVKNSADRNARLNRQARLGG